MNRSAVVQVNESESNTNNQIEAHINNISIFCPVIEAEVDHMNLSNHTLKNIN